MGVGGGGRVCVVAGLREIKAYSASQQSWSFGIAELGNKVPQSTIKDSHRPFLRPMPNILYFNVSLTFLGWATGNRQGSLTMQGLDS